jgi:glycosyltransferase involved in cell wall biosynthesis
MSTPIPTANESIPLFITQLEGLGGAERSWLALASWLHRQDVPAHFVTYTDGCNFAQFADFPLRIDVLNPQGGVRAKVAALKQYFREHNFTHAPLVSGYQPALHATLAGICKFHCLMHDTPALFSGAQTAGFAQRARTAMSSWLIGVGLRRGGGQTIVTSEFLQKDSRREFGVNAQIARMGGFGNRGVFIRRPVEGELRMLSVSRIEANKRVEWMLDALAELERAPEPLSARLSWRLDVVGRGSQLEAMRARAAELGLGERVHFPGFVSDEELAALYERAHLFLMPAVQGYGIPAVEALGRGIPVLLHRESGVSDILLDTPWAAVLTGGKEEIAPRLAAMIDYLRTNAHLTAPPPPELPSEDHWAERVARICGYI